ncbi:MULTISPECIES: type IV pilus twitching motility protein PilT [Candidatus Ichthyocystis]|uniref:Putative twitching motility protein n=1 Tax=Candidatus Ichthyocystis hellenicum TaxID=1561003 RepID=A0A0S4M6M4_9BURK|nr:MULTISPECIES: PilT/PilU family type 4a pilus ATPase [Ichthyocystis]CUT17800.1 putative twitching motility protein [Candidatus Ichthyocystis hellenicum]
MDLSLLDDDPDKFVSRMLESMLSKGASNAFLIVPSPLSFRISGEIFPQTEEPLLQSQVNRVVNIFLTDYEKEKLRRDLDVNFSYMLPGTDHRFRVSVFRQAGHLAAVIRTINSDIPSIDSMGLPEIFKDIALYNSGLVLFGGPTNAGKSTSIATLIDYRNRMKSSHILILEEPLEYVHKPIKSVITHREISHDAKSWNLALKYAMRQSPDMLFLGEVLDIETMENILQASTVGHFVLTTIHANTAVQVIERCFSMFADPMRQNQVLMNLALNLRAVVCQRLIRSKSNGVVPMVEVMINNHSISNCIMNRDLDKIPQLMEVSSSGGMQTFQKHLVDLIGKDKISVEDALWSTDNSVDLQIALRSAGLIDAISSSESSFTLYESKDKKKLSSSSSE